MQDKIKFKRVTKISFLIGVVISLIYLFGIIMLESKNYSSLNIKDNIGLVVIISLLNGIFYAMYTYLFIYFKNKFTNYLKWLLPLLLTIITLVVYIISVTALTIGFIISLTGF